MTNSLFKKYFAVCAAIFTLFLFFTPQGGFQSDIDCWIKWAVYIFDNGLGEIYHSNTDYLPIYHYVLKAYSVFQNSSEQISEHIRYLKLFTLLFHFVSGYFLILLINKNDQYKSIFYSLFYLLNIPLLYNSMLWGQVDAILTTFIFISVFFAIRKKIGLSLIFFVLAMNFKMQAIIFLPIIGLLLLPLAINNFSLKNLTAWILIPMLVQFLIIIPFILSGTTDKVLSIVFGSVDRYPFVSMNAHNLWSFFVQGNLTRIPDTLIFLGLTYKLWGLILFFSISFLALIPLLKACFKSISKKEVFAFPIEKVLIICALIPLIFFYFNTQMHERYSHSAFIFLITYAILKKKPTIAFIGCLAYLINLEDVLQITGFSNYGTVLFSNKLVAILYFITISWLFILLFDIHLSHKPKHENFSK